LLSRRLVSACITTRVLTFSPFHSDAIENETGICEIVIGSESKDKKMKQIFKQGLHLEGAAMSSNAGARAAGLRYSAFIGNRLRRGSHD
ncbi:hypothetical protein, partial [Rugamonas violacea]|uniref:hypothetical protein n=1 Tax=Rugamonas sp. CCM 8940 TaxID=2765359 RepID=UPI001F22735A